MDATRDLDDESWLLFGSGFVFGVMFALFVLAIILVTVVSGQPADFVGTQAFVVLAAGIVFPAIVGASLFLLAFPANRQQMPLDTEWGAVGAGGLVDEVDGMAGNGIEGDGMEGDGMKMDAVEDGNETDQDLEP
jgi:hypothetical protein